MDVFPGNGMVSLKVAGQNTVGFKHMLAYITFSGPFLVVTMICTISMLFLPLGRVLLSSSPQLIFSPELAIHPLGRLLSFSIPVSCSSPPPPVSALSSGWQDVYSCFTILYLYPDSAMARLYSSTFSRKVLFLELVILSL